MTEGADVEGELEGNRESAARAEMRQMDPAEGEWQGSEEEEEPDREGRRPCVRSTTSQLTASDLWKCVYIPHTCTCHICKPPSRACTFSYTSPVTFSLICLHNQSITLAILFRCPPFSNRSL